MNTIQTILERGRWAPSGDNTQPWRFAVVDDSRFIVHGFDTRDHVVYDLDGHASQIALGALLQTLEIAASAQHQRLTAQRREGLPETRPTFDVTITPDDAVVKSPLYEFIETRATQRRALRGRRLTPDERRMVEAAVGAEYEIYWWESVADKVSLAAFLYTNARLRMITPEAFAVHGSIVDWGQRYSAERIPDQALGLNPITTLLSKWTLQRSSRMRLMNSIPGATAAPRLELDFLPAVACGAHYAILARRKPESIDDYIAAGRAVQRVWLTITSLRLWQQPTMTPLIFSRYVREHRSFTSHQGAAELARRIAQRFARLLGEEASTRAVWMARLGAGAEPQARSLRKPLAELMISE